MLDIPCPVPLLSLLKTLEDPIEELLVCEDFLTWPAVCSALSFEKYLCDYWFELAPLALQFD